MTTQFKSKMNQSTNLYSRTEKSLLSLVVRRSLKLMHPHHNKPSLSGILSLCVEVGIRIILVKCTLSKVPKISIFSSENSIRSYVNASIKRFHKSLYLLQHPIQITWSRNKIDPIIYLMKPLLVHLPVKSLNSLTYFHQQEDLFVKPPTRLMVFVL